MKRTLAIGATLAALAIAAVASAATPNVNGAVVKTRVWNDCPSSTVTPTNNYPASIVITDQDVNCFGFANLHNWHFSADGGATEAVFDNNSMFRFGFDLVESGGGNGEVSLQVAPWWGKDSDGLFNVRSTDGEIACFGGRLPFFSFTSAFGLHYVKGDMIHLEVTYLPNGLSSVSPATIEYKLVYNSNAYTSGPLAFDMANPSEDPPYGLWGMLNDARCGSAMKAFLTQGGEPSDFTATWSNIFFDPLAVPVQATTWGHVKAIYNK